MNPWAIILMLFGAACLIVAAKGTQDNVISAIKGSSYSPSTDKLTSATTTVSMPNSITTPTASTGVTLV